MIESPIAAWATIGLMLTIFELFAPGVYLIWFGFAAFVVSGYVYFFDVGMNDQLIVFAISSVIFATLGLFVYKKIFGHTGADDKYKNLNDPAKQYVGRLVTLTQDVDDNNTKVKVGDTVWLAYCEQNLKKNDKARVVDVKDGVVLVIEKEN